MQFHFILFLSPKDLNRRSSEGRSVRLLLLISQDACVLFNQVRFAVTRYCI